MKPFRIDPSNCRVCLAPLPSRYERANPKGRPRVFCSNLCKERHRRLVELLAHAESRDREGEIGAARHILARVDASLRLWRGEA